MRSLILLAAVFVPAQTVSSQTPDVPFDAIVDSDEALVHTGHGNDKHYPTQNLKRGTKVRVLRADFGGWYMIAPPQGSFSWVRAEYVDRSSNDLGVVTESSVDYIGSSVYDGNLTIFHKLGKGETVEVVGEETLDHRTGPVKMYKIRPPRGENRYIKRRDVVPAGDFVQGELPDVLESAAADRPANSSTDGLSNSPSATPDPFAEGASLFPTKDSALSTEDRKSEPSDLPSTAREGVATSGPSFQTTETSSSDSSVDSISNAWSLMEQTDRRFREMVTKPTAEWDIPSIRRTYLEIRNAAADGGFGIPLEQRLVAVDRYQKLQTEQIDFERIMKRTESRDEEIRKSYSPKWHSASTTNPSVTTVRPPKAGPAPTTEPRPPVPPKARARGSSPFNGAGIIQRAAIQRAGSPSHVLLAPDGRVLSYLQAGPGINLDQYLGRAMGLIGPRGFRQQLNADFMIVQRLSPVRLLPSGRR